MRTQAGCARRALAVLLACGVWPAAGLAFANVAEGEPIENVELPTLAGGRHALLSREALANVFVFFRPQQEHSLETLRQMAACEKELAGKRIHWVAVVSSTWPQDEVRRVVAESGIQMPVLVDEGDALYGRLGVRLHPVVGIADEKHRLVAYEPFHKVNYCDRIRAKIRFALKEIDAAAVARSENPERALQPNELTGAVAKRHLRMGEGYVRSGQFEKAAAEAQRALGADASLAPAQLLLGDALSGLGRCEEASRAYAAARALDAKTDLTSRGRPGSCPSPP